MKLLYLLLFYIYKSVYHLEHTTYTNVTHEVLAEAARKS